MSEMLGNQYFIARNYPGAAQELEKALLNDQKSKPIKRKLIICFNEIGQIEKALQVFLSLVKQDAEFIINTDPVADDCPCPELVYIAENQSSNFVESFDYAARMGMLWLYCDVQKSLNYFDKAINMKPNDSGIKSVLAILDTYRSAPK
jgi:tetratricopeptide (TPR) repeat protein